MKILPSHFGAIWDYLESIDIPDEALVIDIGGGQSGWNRANYIVDLKSFAERTIRGEPEHVTKDTWIQGDVNESWDQRFADKHFDLVLCNHTLEDIRDPIAVLHKIKRISQRAIIGMPHWTYESCVVAKRDDWELISGFPHHRWLVGINKSNNNLEFLAKQTWFIADEDYNTDTPNLNIDIPSQELSFSEITNIYPGASKRAELISWLSDRWL